jgi:uncharacterized protein YecT (DUF1311 family)
MPETRHRPATIALEAGFMKTRHLVPLLCISLLVVPFVVANAQSISTIQQFLAAACEDSPGRGRPQCESELLALDRELNDVFQAALIVRSRIAKLRAEQRAWLAANRDGCASFYCAQTVIEARIAELRRGNPANEPPRATPMTDDEVSATCESIANLASLGELGNYRITPEDLIESGMTTLEKKSAASFDRGAAHVGRMFVLPVRPGRRAIFAELQNSGTCSGSEFKRVSAPIVRRGERWPSEVIDIEEEDEVIRWKTFGDREWTISLRGRYYFISGDAPQIVTWVTPAGTMRPICRLEMAELRVDVASARRDRALCESIAAKDAPRAGWKPLPFEEAKAVAEPQSQNVVAAERATVDVDNDGEPDSVVRLNWSSGAGCGSSWAGLKRLSSHGASNALTGFFAEGRERLEIYDLPESRYIFARTGRTVAAAQLYRLSRGALETECEFRTRPLVRVKTVYPLEGAVLDPARANGEVDEIPREEVRE